MLTVTSITEHAPAAARQSRALPSSSRNGDRANINASASWWTLADLAVLFGRGGMARVVRRWRIEHDFPAPLPWCRRELRWNPDAVLRWKAEHERRAGSL